MTITNITLAAGVWSVPLPAETTGVGVVVSATSGIGVIFTGIEELPDNANSFPRQKAG